MNPEKLAKLKEFDPDEHLEAPEDQVAFLAEAFESRDAAFIAHSLGVVARAKGMTEVARDAGVTREALYRALSEKGDPRLSTLMGVLSALGLSIRTESHAG